MHGTFRIEWLDAADRAGAGCLRLALHLLWLVKVRRSAEVMVNQSELAEIFGWGRSKVGCTFARLEKAHLVAADHQQGRFVRVRLEGNPVVPKKAAAGKRAGAATTPPS